VLKYNKEKIGSLVSQINIAIDRLQVLGKLSKKGFLSDVDKIAGAKYHFIIAIEAVVDICNHIISKNGFRLPNDYADTFNVLGEKNLIDKDLVIRLKNMVRFRNRLVHIYWNVDDEVVYETLQSDLGDFTAFFKHLKEFERKHEKQ